MSRRQVLTALGEIELIVERHRDGYFYACPLNPTSLPSLNAVLSGVGGSEDDAIHAFTQSADRAVRRRP